MEITKITTYTVMYSSNKFPRRIWLESGKTRKRIFQEEMRMESMTRWFRPLQTALLMVCLCAILPACAPTLVLTRPDAKETTNTTVVCTAPKDGTLQIDVLNGDATIQGGGPVTVTAPNLRAVASVVPALTGRNRTVDVRCKFTPMNGTGGHDSGSQVFRDSSAPTIVLSTDDPDGDGDPNSQEVGRTFLLSVKMVDRVTGGVDGRPSGLDDLSLSRSPHRVDFEGIASGYYDYVGVPMGAPGGVNGPLTHTETVETTCLDEGGVTITARATDAANNPRRRSINIECYVP